MAQLVERCFRTCVVLNVTSSNPAVLIHFLSVGFTSYYIISSLTYLPYLPAKAIGPRKRAQ